MKIFITGCTAPHASKYSNEKTPSFAGILNFAFTQLDCDVVWDNPSIHHSKEYLSQFDSIVVGISSPTNMTAHRIYGALSVIKHASELGNLSLFIDTPDPHKIYAGLREIYQNPQSLVKQFYSKRREYNYVLDEKHFANVYGAIATLFTQAWPRTIVPAYPWSTHEVVTKYIPNVAQDKLFLVQPDSVVMELPQQRISSGDGNYWCIDNSKTKWAKMTTESVSSPIVDYRASKWESNEDILERLSDSVGALVSTYKNGDAWWMPSLSQALFVGVPAVTDWRHTAHMGAEWALLPTAVEEMTPQGRLDLSLRQKDSYSEVLPTWANVKENLGNLLLQKTYA